MDEDLGFWHFKVVRAKLLTMNVLMVGAGSVGKIYGYFLSKAGVRVSFLVKEKYVEACKAGFNLYSLNEKNSVPIFWNTFQTLSKIEDVSKQPWDFIILAFASTSLTDDWLNIFIPAIHNTPLLSLQPGLNDQEHLLKFIPAHQLINGTIPIISYEAPLPGEKLLTPGTAFWFPPKSAGTFSGSNPNLDSLLDAFRRANFPIKKVDDAKKQNLLAAPVLMLFIAALKRSHWSFQELKRSPFLNLACDAVSETVQIHAARVGGMPPAMQKIIKPTFLRVFMTIAPHFAPFDLEKYLEIHFSKVGDQMQQGLIDYIEYGKKAGLPTAKLEALAKT